jgi:hypothetical protein
MGRKIAGDSNEDASASVSVVPLGELLDPGLQRRRRIPAYRNPAQSELKAVAA